MEVVNTSEAAHSQAPEQPTPEPTTKPNSDNANRMSWTMSQVAEAQLNARNSLNQQEHTHRSDAFRKAKKTPGEVEFNEPAFAGLFTLIQQSITNALQDTALPRYFGLTKLQSFPGRMTR